MVRGIAAPTRFRVTYTGRADHSGATPMNLRRDALVAGAELVLSVRGLILVHGSPTSVGTVGVLRVRPGAMNVIPGQASLAIDLRDIDAEAKRRIAKKVQAAARRIARKWKAVGHHVFGQTHLFAERAHVHFLLGRRTKDGIRFGLDETSCAASATNEPGPRGIGRP